MKRGTQELRIRFEGEQRTYEVHIPSTYDGKDPMPLVLSFHGGGGQGKNDAELTHFYLVGERHGFITVFPERFRPILERRRR